jgi:hypothetical protein
MRRTRIKLTRKSERRMEIGGWISDSNIEC